MILTILILLVLTEIAEDGKWAQISPNSAVILGFAG